MCPAFAALLLLAMDPEALPSPGQSGSHEAWLREIRSSQARSLQAALAAFDAFSRDHPADAVAAVERCKLIAAATDREDEEPADAQLPTLDECLNGLEKVFPYSSVAVSYRLDRTWGPKAVSFGEHALANPRIAWTDTQRARVYAHISQAQQSQGDLDAAARAARRAMNFDPSIDLTATLGAELLAQGRRTEAIVALSSRTSGSAFELQQKARRLVEARSFFRASWMMGLARLKPGFQPDRLLQARIFEGTGNARLAREAYGKQRTSWNKPEVLLRLFQLELAGTDRDGAARAYQEFRDQGWKFDPLARYRLALLWKFHSAGWRARDLLGIGALLGCVLGFALLPMLWLLPLHSWSMWRRLQLPRPADPPARSVWWFRHVYLASALLLVQQFLAVYVFDYGEIASWIAPFRQPQAATAASAAFGLFYALSLSALLALLLLHQPERLRLLGPGSWTVARSVGQAVVALLLGYAAGALGALLSKGLKAPTAALTIDNLIQSMVQSYGIGVSLFAIAILIPVAEELIFRSIMLDVFAQHLRFWMANVLQALLFAAMHAEPSRLIFYTAMGLLSGRMRRASGGLLPSILFHAANNAIALLLITALGSSGLLQRKNVLPRPDPELLACAKAPGLADALKIGALALPLNNLAWSLAIDPATSAPCLLKAEEAVDAALQQVPENAHYLDTKATVLFRQRRLDEAIDLERGAADLARESLLFSQLDRFLSARQAGGAPLLLGDAAAVAKLSLGPRDSAGRRDLVVELGSAFPEGLVLYARQAGRGGLLQLAVGATHEQTYRLPLPAGIPDEAQFELALLDARGCDDCTGGRWRWRFDRHDAVVDKYP